MVKNHYYGEIRSKLIKKGRQDFYKRLHPLLLYSGTDDEEENDEFEDIQYEYIDLVFPPGSNPPIRHSIKKMSLMGFNQIPL